MTGVQVGKLDGGLMGNREQMDPLVQVVFGDAHEAPTREQPRDSVGDLFFRETYGFHAPGSRPTPKTVEEIAKALQNVRRAVSGEQPLSEILKFFPLQQMADYSAANDPGTFASDFLTAAAAADDSGMRRAIRKLVHEFREDIFRIS
jgi:hypothetical protein